MRPAVNASELDNLIELRHRALATPNAHGEKFESWPTSYAQVWAKKTDLTGQKRYLAQQFSAEQMTEFRLRWRDDIAQTDHLVNLDSEETYELLQIAEIGRREGLDLLCRRLVK